MRPQFFFHFLFPFLSASLLIIASNPVHSLEDMLNEHELAVFALTNQYRMDPSGFLKTWGVNGPSGMTKAPPLSLEKGMIEAAQAHSLDMADCGKMQHESCDGTQWDTRVRNFAPDAKAIAENVAYKQNNALKVLTSWINSSGHRKNILNTNYNGFGPGNEYKRDHFWTQDFGKFNTLDHSGSFYGGAVLVGDTGPIFFVNIKTTSNPQKLQVKTGGQKYDLNHESGSKTSGTFGKQLEISGNCFDYQFIMTDSEGKTHTYPRDYALHYGPADCIQKTTVFPVFSNEKNQFKSQFNWEENQLLLFFEAPEKPGRINVLGAR